VLLIIQTPLSSLHIHLTMHCIGHMSL